LALAFAAGAFTVSLQMFAYDLAGLGWHAALLLAPWVVGGAFWAYRNRGSLRPPNAVLPSFPGWECAALLLVALVSLAIWLPYERLMPLTSQAWDAWAIWLFKAKAFYLDGGIGPFLERSGEFTTQPGYPLLIPLYGAFLYVLNGGVDDQAAKLMSPCFFVALLGVVYQFVRRFATPLVAAAFTVMAATMWTVDFVAFQLAGYADTALSLYMLAAGGFLYSWYQKGDEVDLAGASLAATAAAWTKNEGQFFLMGVLTLVALRLLPSERRLRPWLIALLPATVVLGSWTLMRQAHHVQASGFTLLLDFQPELFRAALTTLAGMAADPRMFNLTFWLLLGAMAAAPVLRVSREYWILPALVAWHLLGALLAYGTGRNEIQWWLGTSANRILAQVAPLALLPAAVVLGRWIEISASDGNRAGKSGGNEALTRAQQRPKKAGRA
jgi:hypothetical protein